jgi:hypothetical protein
VLAAISAYLFVLSTKLDINDPDDPANNTWVTVNWVVAAFVAVLAIITIPIGIVRQNKLRSQGIHPMQVGRQAASTTTTTKSENPVRRLNYQ